MSSNLGFVITELPAVVPAPPELPDMDGAEHPIRKVSNETTFQRDSWTPKRAKEMADFFDEIAPDWNNKVVPEELDGILDALERGGVPKGGRCIEVGTGTGHATRHLKGWFDEVIAVDISDEMLRLMPAGLAPRLLADGSRLPFVDSIADAICLANMFLFPDEVARLLAPEGRLIWYNGIGERTPIHLSTQQVLQALSSPASPPANKAQWQADKAKWHAISSRWQTATWCVLKNH